RDGDYYRAEVRWNDEERCMEHLHELVEQADDVLAGRDSADGAGQHVVEHERGNGELRERPAHRLLDHAVDAAAHEHRARFDVDAAYRIREEHHGGDVPGCSLADCVLDDAADVVNGR